jgi:signal transduction histidine kinase
MIFDRLRIRGKLHLLHLLPLAAVVIVAVPFVATQVENAQSSTATATAASNARQLGALVWELQRERLVTAGYLADPNVDDAAMLLQHQVVADSVETLRTSLGATASDELTSALVRLGSLTELRENARHRGVELDSVARAYHAVIEALIDALRLVPQRTSDAEGTRQLTALDALLRADEESSLRGMALVAAAVRPQVGRDLLATASATAQMLTERFVEQADADQAALVVLVDQGEVAHRLDTLVQRLPNLTNRDAVQSFVSSARTAAEAQSSLRRLVQDQVTSQITDAAAARAGTARAAAWTVGLVVSMLFALVTILAVLVSRSIAGPLQRLTRAAMTVAELANAELVRVTDVEEVDVQPPRLSAINVSSGDEVGELAVAFNQVQVTAAQLLERQAVTRRNVSLMFANVAQRTQNLVRRQLALVDDLERNEQNTQLLAKLYRLDHLSTRLRRNAENLLVIAGSQDGSRISAPTPLTTVLRSALAEIEDYQRVTFGAVDRVTVVAPLVSDLVLVFAELLENATAFSPPQSTVDVHAAPTTDGRCQISIVDHGIGMTAERMAEENRRLVERERLDIVPTSVLGLFVVGRLARRHGLAVELLTTPGGGTTAVVTIPPTLYTSGTAPIPVPPPTGFAGRAANPPRVALPPIPTVPGTFPWFTADRPDEGPENTAEHEQAPPVASPDPAAAAGLLEAGGVAVSGRDGLRRGTLHRRVPGAQLPPAALRSPDQATAGRPVHDAAAARTAMDEFQTAIAQADTVSTAPPTGHTAGPTPLSRRTPGARLAPGLRDSPPTPARRITAAPQRDPEAERAAYDGYAASMARANRPAGSGPTRHDQFPGNTEEGKQ